MNHTNENIGAYVDMLAGKRRSNIISSASDYDHFDTPSYFVSPNGNDANDGTSPAAAWKTLEKANALVLGKECNLLFERGGIWRGSITVHGNVTVSAYGKGEKPLFLGSPENGAGAEKWTKVGGTESVWQFYRELPDCGNIVFDDATFAVRVMPELADGKFVFDPVADLGSDMTFASLAADGKDGALYLRCDAGNPGALYGDIEFAVKGDGLTSLGDNVTVNNLAFRYYGGNGAVCADGVKGFILYFNEYKWIGGSVVEYVGGKAMRGGCGVTVRGSVERHFVDNCVLDQIYDCALSLWLEKPAYAKKVIYSNNLIENCPFSIGYVCRDKGEGSKIDDFQLLSNICRNAGSGWGMSGRCGHCVPSHVNTCGRADNAASALVFKNNIFDGSDGQLVFISAADASSLPRMLKNIYIGKDGSKFGGYGVKPVQVTDYHDIGQQALAALTKEYGAEFYFG